MGRFGITPQASDEEKRLNCHTDTKKAAVACAGGSRTAPTRALPRVDSSGGGKKIKQPPFSSRSELVSSVFLGIFACALFPILPFHRPQGTTARVSGHRAAKGARPPCWRNKHSFFKQTTVSLGRLRSRLFANGVASVRLNPHNDHPKRNPPCTAFFFSPFSCHASPPSPLLPLPPLASCALERPMSSHKSTLSANASNLLPCAATRYCFVMPDSGARKCASTAFSPMTTPPIKTTFPLAWPASAYKSLNKVSNPSEAPKISSLAPQAPPTPSTRG